MTGLRSAIGFLTLLPVSPRDSAGLASARGWFPVVGLFLGAVLASIDLLIHWGYPLFTQNVRSFPPLLSAAILVVAPIVLTRALHLDGFMDCCDGLLGSFDRVRRLEIMRDPRVGAFAVVGVVSLLLVKVAALVSLPLSGRMWVVLVFPCPSRWAVLLAMEVFPYVRRQGLGTAFLQRAGRWQLACGLALALLATLAVAGPFGMALMAVASAVGGQLARGPASCWAASQVMCTERSTRLPRRRCWSWPCCWPKASPTRYSDPPTSGLGDAQRDETWNGSCFPASGTWTQACCCSPSHWTSYCGNCPTRFIRLCGWAGSSRCWNASVRSARDA